MKFKSEAMTQASGSIGGTTYSHNRGGMYRRARSIPTNPNSASQQAIRSFFAQAAAQWGNALSAAQRAAWNNYGDLTPVTSVMGDEIKLSGQQMFVASATFRLRAGATVILDGPTTPGLAELSGVTVTNGSGSADINYDASNAWANSDDGVLAIQTSRNLAVGINYFGGPYRFAVAVDGDGTTPPVSPENLTSNAFGFVLSDQRVAFRIRASDGEGRLSPIIQYIESFPVI